MTNQERLDKKCGQSGIPDNAKCTKQTSSGGNTLLKAAAGAAVIGGAALAASSLRKPKLTPKTLGQAWKNRDRSQPPFSLSADLSNVKHPFRRSPSVPPKKETSVTRRLAEIRRKNKVNLGRPELRDLRAVGMKAERQVQKGSSIAQALSKSMNPKLMKRKKKRDLGSFYKDGHAKTGYVRDRLAKIMDGMKKPKY